ncbi:cation-translocating P-type ATPase [Crocosphaera sp. XPORK-15E]|nr:cation-translocating P-type ATPase [Crocosphaera sp. XPORK-15E]MEA5535488.1 cation-translocating P-type ATPase [Crocosphaera sp. XPORK-15E]
MTNLPDPNTPMGLSDLEAAQRLKQDGYNELPTSKRGGLLAIALEVLSEPIFLLLVACGIIYWLLGDRQEALILLGFIFFIMGITLYQDQKTESALDALRDLSSPRASVIRDGHKQRIAGREVVRGDILILSEGDRVPADALLFSSTNITADESLLTGESLPVRKVSGNSQTPIEHPGGDDLPFVYSGTLIVQGQGMAEVKAIGPKTELGKIGKALQTVTTEDTPLQRETKNLVNKLIWIAIAICVAVIVIYGITRGNWLQGFLAGIALAMAILPNEFPVVLTIFLALGAWRISQNRVLTRRMPAVETLGSATVLCVDKTGTLTLNQMSVHQMVAFKDSPFNAYNYDLTLHELEPLPEAVHGLIEFSILASQKDPFDPMEKAFKQLGDDYLANTEHIHKNWTLVQEYPLSPELLAMSRVWQSSDNSHYVIAAKGAPEAIADLCHFDPNLREELSQHIQCLANQGLRVLGVARGKGVHPDVLVKNALPQQQHDFQFEFLGLIGLADPVRPTVAQSIKECYTAGIRVVMITGDYPGTAQKIAREIGLNSSNSVITGQELQEMGDNELLGRIQTVNIFARMVPEQKLRLVNALKKNGEIVAMTGDGVNDAPALKSAQIGIAMGGRGTDVARESADLVLLDDDFASIVQSVKLGRRIFDNLKKAMAYTLAIHVPIAGMSLIPVLLKWPLVLLPIHIAFLHLIIDPACSIVFEAEPAEDNVMKRPPRDPKIPLFSREMLGLSVLQGVGVLLILVIIFAIAFYRGKGEQEARAFAFTTLIVANLSLILTNRSWSKTILTTVQAPNPALWWVIGGAIVFMGLVLYIPFLRHLFRFSTLHPLDLGICLVGGMISILWFEWLKTSKQSK